MRVVHSGTFGDRNALTMSFGRPYNQDVRIVIPD